MDLLLYCSNRLFWLLLMMAAVSAAQADSANLSETQADKVSCRTYKEDGEKIVECLQNTTGKYSLTASISAYTFEWYGIYLANVGQDTPLGIQVGNFSFQDTLRNARSKSLNWNKLSGVWLGTHEECKINPKSQIETCRNVTDTTVKISASFKGATIKVTGNWSEQPLIYGQKVFAEQCAQQGSGYSFQEPASISVGDIEIPGVIEVRCKQVKTKTVTAKDDNDYELNNMTINAKLIPRLF